MHLTVFLPIATYSLLFHQEERATAQYMEALQFQGSEQWDKAEDIYQNLLESDVLSKVEKSESQIFNASLLDHLSNKFTTCI